MNKIQIDALVAQSDLVSIAEQAGARFNSTHHSACPLHHGTNEQQFHVWDNGRQMWKCFGDCGESGDVIDFVMKWRGIDFIHAIEWLGGGNEIDPSEAIQIAADRAKRAELALEEKIKEAQVALESLRAAQKHLYYHEQLDTVNKRDLWRARGVRDDIQDWLSLGYCPDFRAETKHGLLITATLAMPIFGKGRELLNIRHRLLSALDKDKYRPERSGLGRAAPLLFDPDIAYDCERILWIEGEIKAIVTGQTLDTPSFQVAGIPGATNWKQCVKDAQGKDNYIIFDPGAEQEALKFAREIKGHVAFLPGKIDDMINAAALDRDWILNTLRAARRA